MNTPDSIDLIHELFYRALKGSCRTSDKVTPNLSCGKGSGSLYILLPPFPPARYGLYLVKSESGTPWTIRLYNTPGPVGVLIDTVKSSSHQQGSHRCVAEMTIKEIEEFDEYITKIVQTRLNMGPPTNPSKLSCLWTARKKFLSNVTTKAF